ncbi:MAG: diacylglycerol kinase family protein [Eubacteriaceae bacterium]
MRRKIKKSFSYAIEGIKYTLSTQHNMRIHLSIAILVILVGFAFKISSSEWLAIVIVIGFVFMLEIINTTIETLVDLYTEEYHDLAKIAKDTAAGAVMVAAMMSICVGSIVFLPKIWDWLTDIFLP